MAQYTSTGGGLSTSALGDGSRTITISDDQPREEGEGRQSGGEEIVGTLRLRGHARTRSSPRVVWDESVIDNENAGKKKSKICCIFRKQRRFDESSSSDDSDSDSDVDSCSGHDHNHDHNHSGAGGGDGASGSSQQSRPTPCPSKVHELSDSDEPNAYERMPGSRKKGKRKAPAS